MLAHNCASWETISMEIAKCQVRCIVCHRKRTYSKDVWNRPLRTVFTDLANRQATQRMVLRRIVDEVKARPCVDCGKEFPSCAMDLDHIDPDTKTFCVGRLASTVCSEETLRAEISKCRVLCADCHAIRTDADRGIIYGKCA